MSRKQETLDVSLSSLIYWNFRKGPVRLKTAASRRGFFVFKRLTLTLIAALSLFPASAWAQKPSFTVAWSIYVGWDPYQYMAKSGLLRKWGDKYGVTIKVQRFDYAPSIDAFTSKNVDACAMTNMEALDLPAASGIDTTAIIIGDYSNGNDAVMARDGNTLKTLPGKKVLLVQKTVSEYLLERALVLNNLAAESRKLKLVNTSDSSIVAAFMNDNSQSAVVTWKPLVTQLQKVKGVTTLFDSSKIPGEILDLMVVRSEVLNRPDGSGQKFAKALTGAWYEMMSQMSAAGSDKVLAAIATVSEDTLPSYKEQLSTTHMMYTPQEAATMAGSVGIKEKMNLVRQFCFTHGLLGSGVKSADDVAVKYPDGSVQGKADRVRLRFDDTYMKLAAGGKL
jgi:NitT/TauT family transport system substrate-binding protein